MYGVGSGTMSSLTVTMCDGRTQVLLDVYHVEDGDARPYENDKPVGFLVLNYCWL